VAWREPSWWYGDSPHWQAAVLTPVAAIYGSVAERRFKRVTPYRSRLPVICVGNFTAGGTGKTPLSLVMADIVRGLWREPWMLSRGYGGALDGPVRVDAAVHTAADCGDEPLLLARNSSTVIAADRRAGAEFIERSAPSNAVIIMDDGLQNPSLAKVLTIAVLDGGRGLGNGAVIPSGPLRAPMPFQLQRANAMLIMGEASTRTGKQLSDLQMLWHGQVFRAHTAAAGDTAWLRGAKVVAFAGIANPARFFTTLEGLGAHVTERVVFPDHHTFNEADAAKLLATADKHGAALVTTEKDMVRLSGKREAVAELGARAKCLPITLAFDGIDRERLTELITTVLQTQKAEGG
jgi:tetraacyldisaccharide 4'-kinase